MNLALRPLHFGRRFAIYALVVDGDCQIEDMLAALERDDADLVASAVQLLDRVANHGPPKNKEKSRPVGDGIFELKPKRLRICYFYDANCMIVCTHGFEKPPRKVQDREIKKAVELRETYFNLKANNNRIPIQEIKP